MILIFYSPIIYLKNVKELMLKIKFEQSLHPKSKWALILIWSQMYPLTNFLNKISFMVLDLFLGNGILTNFSKLFLTFSITLTFQT